MIEKSITRKQLKEAVRCPGYVIDYLNDCGRLPVVRESKGHGYPRHYHPSAVDIIKKHLAKQSR